MSWKLDSWGSRDPAAEWSELGGRLGRGQERWGWPVTGGFIPWMWVGIWASLSDSHYWPAGSSVVTWWAEAPCLVMSTWCPAVCAAHPSNTQPATVTKVRRVTLLTQRGFGRERPGFDPWVRRIPWGRARHPTPVFLPGESHAQRSLEGYSPSVCRVGRDWSDLAGHTHSHRKIISLIRNTLYMKYFCTCCTVISSYFYFKRWPFSDFIP